MKRFRPNILHVPVSESTTNTLMFLFHSISVDVPDETLVEWDKKIPGFLWQEKKPRVQYKTLQFQEIKKVWISLASKHTSVKLRLSLWLIYAVLNIRQCGR